MTEDAQFGLLDLENPDAKVSCDLCGETRLRKNLAKHQKTASCIIAREPYEARQWAREQNLVRVGYSNTTSPYLAKHLLPVVSVVLRRETARKDHQPWMPAWLADAIALLHHAGYLEAKERAPLLVQMRDMTKRERIRELGFWDACAQIHRAWVSPGKPQYRKERDQLVARLRAMSASALKKELQRWEAIGVLK